MPDIIYDAIEWARCQHCAKIIRPIPPDNPQYWEDEKGITVCVKAPPIVAGEPTAFVFHKPMPEIL